MLNRYDPESTPNPSEWLAVEEGERHVLVLNYHRDARISLPKAARPIHATVHVAVENQLALEDQELVRATLPMTALFPPSRMRKPGVTAAILQQAGVHVFSEDQLEEADLLILRFEADNTA